LRGDQTECACSKHVIGCANAQDVRKLLEHHRSKLIQRDQRVTRVLVAHRQGNVFIRRAAVGERICLVFDVRDAKREIEIAQLGRHVTVLTGPRLRAIDGLALVLIDTVLPFGISHLLVKFFRLAVLVLNLAAVFIKDRKMTVWQLPHSAEVLMCGI